MSGVSVACLPQYREIDSTPTIKYDLSEETYEAMPISVENSSIILNPQNMKVGKFYCIELENQPYLYRKINDAEIEVYGLAEQD